MKGWEKSKVFCDLLKNSALVKQLSNLEFTIVSKTNNFKSLLAGGASEEVQLFARTRRREGRLAKSEVSLRHREERRRHHAQLLRRVQVQFAIPNA